jgi:integrase
MIDSNFNHSPLKINFYLNSKGSINNPERQIFCYIRGLGKKQVIINTYEKINPDFWDSDNKKAKTRGKNKFAQADLLNNYLHELEKKIRKFYTIFITENGNATSEEIRTAIKEKFTRKESEFDLNSLSFFDALDFFISLKKDVNAAKFKQLRSNLNEFEKSRKIKIKFSSFDKMFYDIFIKWMHDEKKYLDSTVNKKLAFLRTFLHWCNDSGLKVNKNYTRIKISDVESEQIALTEDELLKIYNFDFDNFKNFRDQKTKKYYTKVNLTKARDLFCLQAFTGQRHSDIKRISLEDIKEGYWKFVSEKTNESIVVPLNTAAQSILVKYSFTGTLPKMSSQNLNIYIKQIARLAKITDKIKVTRLRNNEQIQETFEKWELIGSHTARRTFITLALAKGVPAPAVMRLSGHKSFKSFQKYIKLADQQKFDLVNKVFENFGKVQNSESLTVIDTKKDK